MAKIFGLLIVFAVVLLGIATVAKNQYGFSPEPGAASPSPAASPSAPIANPTDAQDMVILEHPVEGQRISSPLTISGRARGNWFFEATAPVVLTDWDGRIIAEGYITAQGEWMTTDHVPFTGTLEFETPSYGERGSLILQKSNPSGLPENDAAYEIPVFFAQ